MKRASPTPPRPTRPAATTGLAPVFDHRARVLVLGSFPGVASLQAGAYYAHPRNQFWPILAALIDRPLPGLAYPDRLQAVLDAGIAIWDVVGRCVRPGSLDSAIRDASDNDVGALLLQLPALRAIAFNGARAARSAPAFAERGYRIHSLPSTSPAHAALSFERKLAAWQRILADLRD